MDEDVQEYLKWFFINADFGPAHGDVMVWLQERYEHETGKKVPADYDYTAEV